MRFAHPSASGTGHSTDTHPQDLAAEPLVTLERRNDLDPTVVEDVVCGCVGPVGEQGPNIGRLAPMVVGWDDGVPGVQLNRMCGSGQEAVNVAAGKIRGGLGDVLVAGGVEHMTRVPLGPGRRGWTLRRPGGRRRNDRRRRASAARP